ncbi:hypothetical protein AX774_g3008 [Zancudomyces culisetae]|uniref:Uncharacterized protein n=1 Tax=Zancudomyces culisetae TaxID=1213189 RepID=A0A1R1PRA0_ZANCU|nr:hypothetical protein AX774_g3008 [Zancudomyces culisetae]|eukprot:OMH83496.1 hypothetical protein AX774_g3008 [Zancudomyces culisetae]
MGALEAGLSPGVVTYLPFWYTLDEIPTRMFMFYTALALTGVFGPVIAYGFSELPHQLCNQRNRDIWTNNHKQRGLFSRSITLTLCTTGSHIFYYASFIC